MSSVSPESTTKRSEVKGDSDQSSARDGEGSSDGIESLRIAYESLLWESMELIGVSESVERKVMAAVTLQFVATLVVFVLPIVFMGPAEALAAFPLSQILATGMVLTLAVVAFVNTLLITQRDVIRPLTEMRSVTGDIARGRLGTEPKPTDQPDEVGDLSRAVSSMHAYLTTVSKQSEALADERFDAEILEADVPGEFGDSLESMRRSLETRIDDLESSRAEIERQNRELEADAERCRKVLRRCAEGDFTHRVEIESDHDAMREIATALNVTLDDVETALASVQTVAEEVNEVGKEVSTSVAEIEDASEEVSRSSEEISMATADQNERFGEVLAEMSTLSATVEEIAATANDVADISGEALTRTQSGSDAATEAVEELDRLERRTESIVELIEWLHDEIDEIDDIIGVINDIATQTNLLAVNAAVEAAHAEGDGDGFAVVADEVMTLADETGQATEDVDDVISEVQGSAEDAVEEVRAMRRAVVDGVETIEESLEALEEITGYVERANDGVQSIDEATDDQARTSQEVVTMVDEATDNSEQTNQEASSVATAAEQQSATIAGIADATQSLSHSVDDLNELLDEFTVASNA